MEKSLLFDIKCPKCGHNYDPINDECPFCGHHNDNIDSIKLNRKVSWFSKTDQIMFFLIGFIGLIILNLIFSIAFINVTDEIKQLTLINSLSYATLFLSFVGLIIYKKKFKNFKEIVNFRAIIFGLLTGLVLTGFVYLYSYVFRNLIPSQINTNELYAEEMISNYPILSFIILGILGPACEELTYRVGLFNFLLRTKKWIAYLVSILFFAFIHFDFTGDLTVELWNLPPYLVAGFALCFVYDKFGFSASLLGHILNNILAIVL